MAAYLISFVKTHKMTEKKLIEKLNDLAIQKTKAIKAQKYEFAAMLRDEIRKYSEILEDLLNPSSDE